MHDTNILFEYLLLWFNLELLMHHSNWTTKTVQSTTVLFSWQNKEYCVSFRKFACLYFRHVTQKVHLLHINEVLSLFNALTRYALNLPWSIHIGNLLLEIRYYFLVMKSFGEGLVSWNIPPACWPVLCLFFHSSTSWKNQNISFTAIYRWAGMQTCM